MKTVPSGHLIALIVLSAISAEMCVSANLLTYIGIPYVTDGGASILKLHPGTDLLIFAFGMIIVRDFGRPANSGHPLIVIYFIAILFAMLWALVLTGTENLVVLLDTFLPAGLMASLSIGMTIADRRKLRRSMQYIFCLNASLALIEVFMQKTLLPLYLNDSAYRPRQEDFRPTAFYDHPLTGALMTMMGLAMAPSGQPVKTLYLTLMWAAMIAFGGRTATAITLFSTLATIGMPTLGKTLRRQPGAATRLVLVLVGGLVAILAGAIVIWSGLAGRLAGHLYWDASAQARLAQWHILDYLDASQMAFGTPRQDLLHYLNALRLASGVGVIENFWLLMFVSLGGVGFTIFLVSISALCRWCWISSGPQGRILLVSALIVASTSNSLGRKSTVLVCLVASIACVSPDINPGRQAAGQRGPAHLVSAV